MSDNYIPAPLRREVYHRANGRCEYCHIPENYVLVGHQIDHIIARKHGGQTEADNLALSCVLCNQHKGSDLASIDPQTGHLVRLYHPRRDRWEEHFELNSSQLEPLTPIGRVTVRLLQLNRPDRIKERQLLIMLGVI